jgi:hypothetical protein
MSIQQFPAADGRMNPIETLLDPVNKLRVSNPESLIDTDFEYGTQTSKWENLGVVNNRPFASSSATALSNVATISMPTNSKTVTVSLNTQTATPNAAVPGSPISDFVTYTTTGTHNFEAGSYVKIAGASISGYNGIYLITSTPTATTFVVANTTLVPRAGLVHQLLLVLHLRQARPLTFRILSWLQLTVTF